MKNNSRKGKEKEIDCRVSDTDYSDWDSSSENESNGTEVEVDEDWYEGNDRDI